MLLWYHHKLLGGLGGTVYAIPNEACDCAASYMDAFNTIGACTGRLEYVVTFWFSKVSMSCWQRCAVGTRNTWWHGTTYQLQENPHFNLVNIGLASYEDGFIAVGRVIRCKFSVLPQQDSQHRYHCHQDFRFSSPLSSSCSLRASLQYYTVQVQIT